MSALFGRRWCQMFTRNVGLHSRSFSSVNCLKFGQSHFRGSTRILQKDRNFSPDSHERKLNALTGGQPPVGLHKEPMRCLSDQTDMHDHHPGASAIRVILPMHERPNGTVDGSVLVEEIIQTATITVNRYCNQHINTIGAERRHAATLCSLSSVDEVKFFRPLRTMDVIFLKGSVIATSEHMLLVEVSIEKTYAPMPDVVKPVNLARLSFIANNHHDLSQRQHVIPLRSHVGGSGDHHHLRPIPPKGTASSHTISDPSEFVHPDTSSVTLIHPMHCLPPPQLFCRPGHLCRLMEGHGIIVASRLTHHDVVSVHMSNITFHEHVLPRCAVVVSGEVASMAGDVLTLFLTVDMFYAFDTTKRKHRVVEGHFSYIPINSAKDRVSIPGHQVLSAHGQHLSQHHKEVGIEHNVVDSYATNLKKLQRKSLA